MMAVLYHNHNIESEKLVVEQLSLRIGQANGAPSWRVHKTIVYQWQKCIMAFILQNAELRHIDNQLEIIDEYNNNQMPEQFKNFHLIDHDYAMNLK